MSDDVLCPKCKEPHECNGIHEDDAGDWECEKCGFHFIVEIDYEPIYSETCKIHEYGEKKAVGKWIAAFCIHCGACDSNSLSAVAGEGE